MSHCQIIAGADHYPAHRHAHERGRQGALTPPNEWETGRFSAFQNLSQFLSILFMTPYLFVHDTQNVSRMHRLGNTVFTVQYSVEGCGDGGCYHDSQPPPPIAKLWACL